MWVVTTDNHLVNIAAARKIVIETDDNSDTAAIVAYFGDAEAPVTLAEATQRGDPNYAATVARAYYKAIQEALRDGEPFCNLCTRGEPT